MAQVYFFPHRNTFKPENTFLFSIINVKGVAPIDRYAVGGFVVDVKDKTFVCIKYIDGRYGCNKIFIGSLLHVWRTFPQIVRCTPHKNQDKTETYDHI
jgi:hypothetical protein